MSWNFSVSILRIARRVRRKYRREVGKPPWGRTVGWGIHWFPSVGVSGGCVNTVNGIQHLIFMTHVGVKPEMYYHLNILKTYIRLYVYIYIYQHIYICMFAMFLSFILKYIKTTCFPLNFPACFCFVSLRPPKTKSATF